MTKQKFQALLQEINACSIDSPTQNNEIANLIACITLTEWVEYHKDRSYEEELPLHVAVINGNLRTIILLLNKMDAELGSVSISRG